MKKILFFIPICIFIMTVSIFAAEKISPALDVIAYENEMIKAGVVYDGELCFDVNDFDTTKASAFGDYLNAKLGMDKDERPIYMRVQNTYPAGENMVFIFANGKGVRIPITAYETKGNRSKLKGAYSSASPLVGIFYEVEKDPLELMLISDGDRAIVLKTSLIPVMSTRSSGGVVLMQMGRRDKSLVSATLDFDAVRGDPKGYRKYKIPATGVPLEDKLQMTFDDIE